jgi:hypothetical protein
VFDCDVLTSTLSPPLLKRITRQTLRQFGSMYWQVLAGTLTFPVQVAVKFRIPLIIWGVHPWSEQTGMFSHLDEVEMTERCRKEHGLMGIAAEDLINESAGISRSDVQPFVYPYDNELEAVGVRGIYLSNYIRWDAKAQHEEMIRMYGYEAAVQQRTFNTYEDVHCFHSAGLHDYIKYLRLGYGKVTDHASREIRLRRMTRQQGIEMVRRYSEVEPADIDKFLDWVEWGRDELLDCVRDRRDPMIWQKSQNGHWSLSDSLLNHGNDPGIAEARLQLSDQTADYRTTPTAEPVPSQDGYILMGRGYLDKYDYGAVLDQPVGVGLTTRIWQRPSLTGG